MNTKLFALCFALALLLTACGGQEVVATAPQPETASPRDVNVGTLPAPVTTPAPVEETGVQEPRFLGDLARPPAFRGETLPTARGDYFAASGMCSACHSAMRDAAGNDVSIDTYWRATMMANAARDPYWQAAVRAEVMANPAIADVIEDTCARCHMPMARTTSAFQGEVGKVLDEGYLNAENDLHVLAMDGVSCTLCHQIEDQYLGSDESFDGGYVIDSATPMGERVTYGPYQASENDARLMSGASGFVPVQGTHLQTSALCATCHTLYTPTVDAQGNVVGHFPEQTPYQEWEASDYADRQSCQDCHMPEVDGEVSLSITNSPPRSPFSRHAFAGGNTYALMLLRSFGQEIGVTADSDHLDAALQRAITQLREGTAQIAITQTSLESGTLSIAVQVTNQTGHKLPTGYPSRRLWLHLTVEDARGTVLFESGGWNADGSIVGNDNDADPLAFEPHYRVIDSPDQVQIYEAIFVDTDGAVTTTLLRGYRYVKDNRLLPSGFVKDGASEDIAVRGQAVEDDDFRSPGDTVTYRIPVGDAPAPYTVRVELLYQSIGYRWAQKMAQYDAAETSRFMNWYEQVPNLPVLIAEAVQEVTP